MKKITKRTISGSLAVGLSMLAGGAVAHDPGSLGPGTPTCIESNIMMADAQNTPFATTGPAAGRVLEMNTTTGYRGITVTTPFTGSPPLCPSHVACPGPFKPTGILSGGEDGHAYLTSAVQHALVEHHRNGTAIKTNPTAWPTDPSPTGDPSAHGFVPRLLGTSFMPNGNIVQTVCDANFFNANNSDPFATGESAINPANGMPRPNNSSWMYFPPVYSTATRGANGRILVIDQDTLEVIDEYSAPTGANADPRWNCPAGLLFTSEGMFVSMFHGAAVFVVDWRDGVDKESRGVGANKQKSCGSSSDDDGDNCQFKLGKKKNEAKIVRVIDLLNEDMDGDGILDAPPAALNDPNRRDSLRAIRMSEDGTLYGTFRQRSAACTRGQAPGASPSVPGVCNPNVFRQHVFVAGPGLNHKTGTIALDPGVNVIAGVTINRMSGPGCEYVTGQQATTVTGDECDVETMYVGVSAGNAGCPLVGGVSPNVCFEPRGAVGGGGTLYEYRIDAASIDGASASCTGNPAGGAASFGAGGANEGCAMPIAQFDFLAADGVTVETLDPRMVMTIHEAFVQ